MGISPASTTTVSFRISLFVFIIRVHCSHPDEPMLSLGLIRLSQTSLQIKVRHKNGNLNITAILLTLCCSQRFCRSVLKLSTSAVSTLLMIKNCIGSPNSFRSMALPKTMSMLT